jgi:hypothetical protein
VNIDENLLEKVFPVLSGKDIAGDQLPDVPLMFRVNSFEIELCHMSII